MAERKEDMRKRLLKQLNAKHPKPESAHEKKENMDYKKSAEVHNSVPIQATITNVETSAEIATAYGLTTKMPKTFLNLKKAFEILKPAADNHDNHARYILAKCVVYDNQEMIKPLIPKDMTVQAFIYHYLAPVAEAEDGVPQAKYLCGQRYLRGEEGFPHLPLKGFQMIKSAAKTMPLAKYLLALCYLDGEGTAKDPKRGSELLHQAVQEKQPEAYYVLAKCYKEGEGVEKDFNHYYQILIQGITEANCIHCKCELAYRFYLSKNQKPDIKATEARQFLLQGVAKKHPKALFVYGHCCLEGHESIPKNVDQGIQLFSEINSQQPSNLLGLSDQDLFFLANSYYNGNGIPIDKKRAFEFYQGVNETNVPDVNLKLAICYYDGDACPADKNKALSHINQCNMTPKNQEEFLAYKGLIHLECGLVNIAFQSLQEASQLGHATSQLILAEIYLNPASFNMQSFLKIDFVVAIKYLNELITASNEEVKKAALHKIGFCYLRAEGVAKNIRQGLEYIIRSAILNNPDSIRFLVNAFKIFIHQRRNKSPTIKDEDIKIEQDNYSWITDESLTRKDSLSWLKIAAFDCHDPEAALLYGCYLLNDKGVDNTDFQVARDENAAYGLFLKAQSWPKGEGINAKAVCIVNGWGIKADPKKAIKLLEESMRLGSMAARNNLAWCLLHGIGVQQDVKAAIEHFSTIKDQYSIAKVNFAWCLLNGIGMPQNIAAAIEIFSTIKAGDSNNCYFGFSINNHYVGHAKFISRIKDQELSKLGLCYINGWGMEINIPLGISYLQDASSRFLTAKFEFIDYYIKGLEGQSDLKAAFELIKQCYHILDGSLAFPEKINESLMPTLYCQLFEKLQLCLPLIENQNHEVNFYLALCLLHGLGVKKDIKGAIELLKQISDQGMRSATVELAKCYKNGIGVEINLEEALQCLIKQENLSEETLNQLSKYLLEIPALQIDRKIVLDSIKTCLESSNAVLVSLAQFVTALCFYQSDSIEEQRQAFKCFEKAAEANNADAHYFIALCYKNGKGVEKNIPMAIESLRLAAQYGHRDASVLLAGYLLNGKEVDLDRTTAIKLLSDENLKSHGEALNTLAICQFMGWNEKGKKSKKLMMDQLVLASQQGNLSAINNLAWFQMFGIGQDSNEVGEEKDSHEAIQLSAISKLEATMKAGSIVAQLNFAWFLMNGIGTKQDKERAIKLFCEVKERAGITNPLMGLEYSCDFQPNIEELLGYFTINMQQIVNLAECFLRGYGVPRNIQKALDLVQPLKNKPLQAQFILIEIFSDNKESFYLPNKSLEICFEVLSKQQALNSFSAEMQLKTDKDNLGELDTVYHLQSDDKTLSKIVEFMTKILRSRDNISSQLTSKAYFILGLIYLNGLGEIPKNEKIAVEMLTAAQQAGHMRCNYYLAQCYKNGVGTAIDIKKSVEFLKLAVENQDTRAYFEYSEHLLSGEIVTQDKKRAVELLKCLDYKTQAEILNLLGINLLLGFEGRVDLQEAIQYFKDAMDAGSKDAENNLIWALLAEGSEQNKHLANKLLRNCDLQTHFNALLNLGCSYIFTLMPKQNTYPFYGSYHKLKNLSNPQYILCLSYIGNTGDRESLENFLLKHQSALLLNLAYCYMNQVGVKLDYNKALYLLENSDQNNPFVLHCQILIHTLGLGVERNYIKAYPLIMKLLGILSSSMGAGGVSVEHEEFPTLAFCQTLNNTFLDILQIYGVCLFYGYGTSINLKKAILVFQRCLEFGNKDVALLLAESYEKIGNIKEAILTYRSMINKDNNITALSRLAELYEQNKVPPDLTENLLPCESSNLKEFADNHMRSQVNAFNLYEILIGHYQIKYIPRMETLKQRLVDLGCVLVAPAKDNFFLNAEFGAPLTWMNKENSDAKRNNIGDHNEPRELSIAGGPAAAGAGADVSLAPNNSTEVNRKPSGNKA